MRILERHELNATRVAEIIRAQFPDVRPTIVSHLGEGYDSTAFEVDAEWVFRFPKRSDIERQLLMEMRVLPVLAKASPLPVPAYCFHGAPSDAFPRHFGGYAKLSGLPAIGLDPVTVPFGACAPVLARFLSWLHGYPADEAARLGVVRQDVASLIDEVRADALGDFGNVNQAASDKPLEEWHAYLADGPGTRTASSSTPVLVHGDLAAEHILYDPVTRAITGIIDWSDIALSDRSLDLAALFHWGGRPFVDAVLAAYDGSVDEATLRRARFLAACRGVGDVTFGLETGRREYIEAGVRALTLCIGR
jgi:aminoglycoside 2''-phosphotransferase